MKTDTLIESILQEALSCARLYRAERHTPYIADRTTIYPYTMRLRWAIRYAQRNGADAGTRRLMVV